MKILFWILAILSIPAGLFMSVVCYFSSGLGLTFTIVGDVVYIFGMFAAVVSIVCMVLGIIKLRKGNVKKAVTFALVGLLYSALILGGIYGDDAVDTMLMKKDIAKRNDELYGENWNTPSAIEGIPERYQEELNKFYVAVRDEWPSDQLMDLCAVAMQEYYGDAALDNIGFSLTDVNGDDVVNVADVTYVVSIILGTETWTA